MTRPSPIRASRSDADGRRTSVRRRMTPSQREPVEPTGGPVFAGDLGPSTWVVEVPAATAPVALPRGAIAVLAGFLPPHTRVIPVRTKPSGIRDVAV